MPVDGGGDIDSFSSSSNSIGLSDLSKLKSSLLLIANKSEETSPSKISSFSLSSLGIESNEVEIGLLRCLPCCVSMSRFLDGGGGRLVAFWFGGEIYTLPFFEPTLLGVCEFLFAGILDFLLKHNL